MKRLRRVVWSKGMFLTPQHFQAQDNFHDESVHFRFTATNFANWGVSSLDVDAESLTNGVFTVRSCRGVMPDGLAFNMPESDDPPAGRPLAQHFGPAQEHLDVYLAIPERKHAGRNIAPFSSQEVASNGAATRFSADIAEVTDEIQSEESKTVQIARKNFRWLFEGQNLDGYTATRLARVTRNAAGAYVLAPEFVAPCLDIASSEFVMNLLRRQIETLASKANSLSASRRQRGQGVAEFNVSEIGSFWLLHTVNSFLPELKHYWTVRRGHPELLFLSMLRLAGALSTFSLDARSHDLPDYDHNELGFCFRALDDRISNLIETVIPSKCISIPLRPVDNNVLAGTVINDDYFKGSQFFLAVSARMGVDDIIKKTAQLVKITSAEEIQNHVRLALPGITLRHMPSPPPAIPFKLENQYFSLNQSGRLWERITQSKTFGVFLPPDVVDANVELLVVLQ